MCWLAAWDHASGQERGRLQAGIGHQVTQQRRRLGGLRLLQPVHRIGQRRVLAARLQQRPNRAGARRLHGGVGVAARIGLGLALGEHLRLDTLVRDDPGRIGGNLGVEREQRPREQHGGEGIVAALRGQLPQLPQLRDGLLVARQEAAERQPRPHLRRLRRHPLPLRGHDQVVLQRAQQLRELVRLQPHPVLVVLEAAQVRQRRRAERTEQGGDGAGLIGERGARLRLARLGHVGRRPRRGPPRPQPEQRPADQRHGRDPRREPMRLRPPHRPPHRPGPGGQHPFAVEEALQVVGQRGGRAVAPVGLLLQAAHHDGVQVHRDGRVELARRCGVVLNHPRQQLQDGAFAVRRLAGERRVQRGPQRVDVGALIQLIAQRLLRRHEGGRPHNGVRTGQLHGLRIGRRAPRQAEVGDPGRARLVDDDVGRFEVAMEDVVVVRVLYRTRRLHHPARQVGEGVVGVGAQQLVERAAGHQLHGEVELVALGAGVPHAHDVGMAGQLGGRLRLALEPLRLLGGGAVAVLIRKDDLEGDLVAQAGVAGAVDHAHAATAELVDDLIRADALPHALQRSSYFFSPSCRRLRPHPHRRRRS
jgi:hypothetical protein